jgi:proteasome lid subunit RPN8/RPN11
MLRMDQTQFDAIREHGEATYPLECCGVLLGRSSDGINVVSEAVRAENMRNDSAHNRYQIAPQELIRIQREGRGRGLDIVGFYHSHPDHPAQWSKTDLAEAHWLGCSYVITSVGGEHGRCRATETNSFLLAGTGEEDKRLEPEPIEVAVPAADSLAATIGA